MNGLMMHTIDGQRTGLAEVKAVPLPDQTDTYHPVAHNGLVEFVRTRAKDILGLEVLSEEYGLSRKGMQMFGVMTLDTGNDENGLSIGLRNSYDKSLRVGIASGAQVFVCDNLCFSGSATVVLRKHTLHVWRDIRIAVDNSLRDSVMHYEEMNRQLQTMKDIPLGLDAGYDLIGRALGYDVLKPQQATIALKDWMTPRHEDFSERNLYSMYNCFTEALKKGAAGDSLSRHTKAHEFFEHRLPEKPITIGPPVLA